MSRCSGCGAALRAGVNYCGACGRAERGHARAVATAARVDRRTMTRSALACGVAVALPLLGLTLVSGAGSTFALLLATALLTAIVAGGFGAAWPLRVSWRWLAAAVPAAAVTFGAAVAWVTLLPHGLRAPGADADATPWLAAIVLAPVAEELLCRGAAYHAAARLAPPRLAVVLSAVLFAFLHGLNGIYWLELVHRFVAGLVFGWLRWRSGSLLPSMCAHALHNAAALAIRT
jgi:membrane protease YdiL (CAAX protease family)